MDKNSNSITETPQSTTKRGKNSRKKMSEKTVRKEPVAIKINEDEALAYAESIIDTIREPLIVLDQDLRVVKVNRSFYKLFKVKPEETVGQLIYDLGNKQWDIPKLRELLDTILPQKTSFDNYEVEHDFATIGKRIMLLNARQIRRVLGKERIILLAIEDITERREIENGLEKTRKELKVIKQSADEASDFAESVINTVHEPLISLDKDLRVVTVSRSFYEFFKVKPEDTVGQLIYDLGNKQWDIPKLRELLETILPQKTSFDNYEVEHVFATIGKRIMLLNARQIQQASGKERIILLAIEDITELKKTEEILINSEILYRRFFETVRDGILILDEKTGTVVNVNPFMVEMLGFSREEFLGKKIWELGFLKDIIANRGNFEELKRKKYITYENLPLETAGGRQIEVEFVSNVYDIGNQKLIQCNIRDITIRRRMEIEREKYIKDLAEKNSELERFNYTVSHELKSPLVTIKTFLGYLEQDIATADKERIEKDKLFMNNAADKMWKLLAELLEMSRVGRIVDQPVEVSFSGLVQETLGVIAGSITEKGVTVKVSDEPVTLYGDRSRLIEIWQNLIENAVKFMGDQPAPQIDIGVEYKDNQTVFFVCDNGIGIEPKYYSKLFNMFEKLNPKMEGTGMGLAITKRIVELYQGKIWVESKGLGQGTTFFFTLPGALKDKKKGV